MGFRLETGVTDWKWIGTMDRPYISNSFPVGPAELSIAIRRVGQGHFRVGAVSIRWENQTCTKDSPGSHGAGALKFTASIAWLVWKERDRLRTAADGSSPIPTSSPTPSPSPPRPEPNDRKFAELVESIDNDHSRESGRTPYLQGLLTRDALTAVDKLVRWQGTHPITKCDFERPWQVFIQLERFKKRAGLTPLMSLRSELLPHANVTFRFEGMSGDADVDLQSFLCEYELSRHTTDEGKPPMADAHWEQTLRGVVREELDKALHGFAGEFRAREHIPKRYKDFHDAQGDMEKVLHDRLSANEHVLIRILAVTAQYSWKELLEANLTRLLELGDKRSTIDIELLLVAPEWLKAWDKSQISNIKRTIDGIRALRKAKNSPLASGRVKLKVMKYKNFPHWHGILVDHDQLFLGRTSWEARTHALRSGQNIYRHYTIGDHCDGEARIELFINWFDIYKARGKEI
jgi:hypothetical protein